MFAIGNDELEKAPTLGYKITCDKCGQEHPVEYGTDRDGVTNHMVAFYKCGDKTYLCGINGKDIRK
jgi:hypothetical protein